MEIYAPDTNFFLQCLPADQLDWKQVTQANEVVLLVVREVRKELDRLKSGGNARRSGRARTASALLRRLTTEQLDELELRQANPKVLLKAASRPRPDEMPAGFPVETADEKVVAEVYVSNNRSGGEVTFLSHDTVPLEDAAELGIRTQPIPDAWLLPPEPSDMERQLADFKRRVSALEGRVPKIVLSMPGDGNGPIILNAPYFPPLSEAFMARAMRVVRLKHSVAPNGQNPRIGALVAEFGRADEARWAEYLESHQAWMAHVERLLEEAPGFLSERAMPAKLPLSFSNNGAAGAENLIVRIEARGKFHLVDADEIEDEDDPEQYFPSPPVRPQSSVVEAIMGFGKPFDYGRDDARGLLTMPRLRTPPMARARHEVYWEYDSDGEAKAVEGQCRDFRHGLAGEKLELLIERDTSGDDALTGALHFHVSAGNLAEGIRLTYPIRIEPEVQDTEQLVSKLLREELGVEV